MGGWIVGVLIGGVDSGWVERAVCEGRLRGLVDRVG